MNLEETALRGLKANELLTNDIFKESVSATRAQYINRMIESIDDEGLRQAKQRLVVLNEVIGHITGMMEDGRRAEAELERLQKQK